MLLTEESVYNKAKAEEQYVTFFQNLFVETSNQSKKFIKVDYKIYKSHF